MARNALHTRIMLNALPSSWRSRVAMRVVDGLPADHLQTKPILGLKAMYQLHHGKSPQEVFYLNNKKFQETVPLSKLTKASVVIGFDTSSWILANRAKEINKPFILDQSTAHPLSKELVLRRVINQFPKWQDKFEPRFPYLLEAEAQEHQLASKIVVASTFTKQTLISQGVAADKITVNPYGVDVKTFHPAHATRAKQAMRFLYLGSVSAMKGVPLLVKAWQTLDYKDSELWLVGSISDQERHLIPPLPGLKVLGKYPHSELPELLRQCDVLVFPSYTDGFGLVLLEALASGLPIITTEATGGPDIIENDKEGFIVQSGRLDELCCAMKFFMENPERLREMSVAARCCAERFTWDAYGDRWSKFLEEYV
jgi:starch synthase